VRIYPLAVAGVFLAVTLSDAHALVWFETRCGCDNSHNVFTSQYCTDRDGSRGCILSAAGCASVNNPLPNRCPDNNPGHALKDRDGHLICQVSHECTVKGKYSFK